MADASTEQPENDQGKPALDRRARRRERLWPLAAAGIVLLAAGLCLQSRGRPVWCACGALFLWCGDVQSSHNSQHLLDPYSFTHMLHGVIFFGLLAWALPRLAIWWRFVLAVALEATWELVENSNLVIERYRTATISLGYQGDSIANSFGDVLSCGAGFLLASALGLVGSLILFAVTEIVLVVWIHDSLILSTLMLIYPIEAIKDWQHSM